MTKFEIAIKGLFVIFLVCGLLAGCCNDSCKENSDDIIIDNTRRVKIRVTGRKEVEEIARIENEGWILTSSRNNIWFFFHRVKPEVINHGQ